MVKTFVARETKDLLESECVIANDVASQELS